MPAKSTPLLLAHDAGAIPYRLAVSPRARRVSIRVSPRDGVRVTVPRRHDPREVERFVHSRREWIAKHLGRFEALRRAAPHAEAARPDSIDLPAIGERWTVTYRVTAAGSVTVRERAGAGDASNAGVPPDGDRPQLALFPPAPVVVERALQVSGVVGHTAAVRAALRRWLRRRATA
ncbi:MAG: YgjP-like metallopeptidase domain-containing protein, partial [Burkholderiales bacterium]